jgi:hypothetical protein
MAVSGSLQDIRTKFRRITRSPSQNQISDSDVDDYINTFILWDFPEHLRTFNYRQQFNFFTNPGQDVYDTDTASFAGATNNILYNFQNNYISVHPPVYIAGFNSLYTQSREQFFGIYPILNSIASIGVTGNGTSGPFTGVVNSAQAIIPSNFTQQTFLLQNNVTFSAIGTPGTSEQLGMALVDVPVVDPTTGFKLNYGNLYDPNSAAYQAALANPPIAIDANNNINYQTGQFTLNFPMLTVAGTPINSQTVPQIATLPQAMMFYENQFVIRPVPDQAYRINFEVFVKPTALIASASAPASTLFPDLYEYWQYIAYGAAKKRFEDQMDLDSVQLIMPEFKKQEAMMLRRSLVQWTNERVATIYTEQTNFGNGYNAWGNGNGAF